MKADNTLLFLAMGEVYARQVLYAVLSLLRVYKMRLPASLHVIVYTNTPELFTQFQEAVPLEVVYITKEKFELWQGPQKQLFRSKIKLLQEVSTAVKGKLIYADSDVIFYRNLNNLFSWLNEGKSLLHTREAILATEDFRLYCESYCGTRYLLNSGVDLQVTGNHFMWNAGVIGLDSASTHLLNDVLELNDKLLAINNLILVEQLAFSIVLAEKSTLRECHDTVFHYCWEGGKEKMDTQIKQLLRDYSAEGVGAMVQHMHKYSVYYPSLKDKLMYFYNPVNFTAMLQRKMALLLNKQ